MLRLAGALLMWGGCVLLGLGAGAEVRRRVELLEDLGQALEVLERELTLKKTALPELLEYLSKRASKQGGQLFEVCREELKKGGGIAESWHTALQKSPLNRQEQALLGGLSDILGRYDAQEQGQALLHLRDGVERQAVRGREQVRSLSKLYAVLGVTAGGFLTLTLV